MQPSANASNGYKPKWRHFHPTDQVWVQNPFSEDVVYQVADEYNRPFRYRLVAGKVSELPGGAIATLGVKALVDQLIQNSTTDAALMWDEHTRAKYEKQIILRIKATSAAESLDTPGEINLSKGNSEPDETSAPEQAAELDQGNAFDNLNPVLAPVPAVTPPEVAAGLQDVISASLPAANAVVGSNNAHANAEG